MSKNNKPQPTLTQLSLGMTEAFRNVSLVQYMLEKRILEIAAEKKRAADNAAANNTAPKTKGP